MFGKEIGGPHLDSNHSGEKMNDGPNLQKSLEIKKKSDFDTEIAVPETSRLCPVKSRKNRNGSGSWFENKSVLGPLLARRSLRRPFPRTHRAQQKLVTSFLSRDEQDCAHYSRTVGTLPYSQPSTTTPYISVCQLTISSRYCTWH